MSCRICFKNFPLLETEVKSKDIRTLWMSKNMRKSSKQKQKFYIKFIKSKNPEDELIYKNYESLVEKLRKKSKQIYYSNLLEKRKWQNDAKQRWQILKEITGKVQKKNQSLPTTPETENGTIWWRIHYFSYKYRSKSGWKTPQINKTFDQYFPPTDTQINRHNLSFIFLSFTVIWIMQILHEQALIKVNYKDFITIRNMCRI